MKGTQLALSVQLHQTPGFDNFFAGPNGAAVDALRRIGDTGMACVCGASTSGKTHLLRAAVRAAGPDAIYLSLRDPAPLADPLALLALDDVDAAAADPGRALELLRLIDRRRAQIRPLLLASVAPPAHLICALPDLRTRLEALPLLGLHLLRESDRLELLRLQAAERGLELPDDTARWLLSRLARDAGTLIAVLERLDRAALSAQRRLTVPFVQQVLRGPASAHTSSG